MAGCKIRRVEDNVRTAVAEIFNFFVEKGFAAYPDRKVNDSLFDAIKSISRGGVFLIETPDSNIVGFGLLRSHQFAAAFNRCSELTYFILPEYNRQGLGTRLLNIVVWMQKFL